MGALPPSIATHIPLYGRRLLHDQGNLWKTTWRSYERFGCEFGYLGNVHEYHSSSSGSYRQRLWREFKICKESSLGTSGTAFQGNRKAGQWSDRNRWHKRDWFPRFEVDVDKLIAQSSLSIFQCQSLRLLRLCTLFGKDGRRSCWIRRAKFNGIQTIILSKIWIELMDNIWISSGRFPRIHYSGNPQWDSTDDGRITVWTRELHRQDHLHVNV